jgi:phosphosulfolactate synthase (CoM biosynthesis protein A)
MGHHVDGLKFAGGSFSLFPEDKLRELIDLAHEHGVYVSTVCISPEGHSPNSTSLKSAHHRTPGELTP